MLHDTSCIIACILLLQQTGADAFDEGPGLACMFYLLARSSLKLMLGPLPLLRKRLLVLFQQGSNMNSAFSCYTVLAESTN